MLEYLNYATMVDPKKELLHTDMFDFECSRQPQVGYWPDISEFKKRVKKIEGFKNPEIENLKTDVRGFPILSPGMAKIGHTEITFTCIEYSDRTLTTFCMNLKNATSNAFNRTNAPLYDVTSDWTFWNLDSMRRPVQTWYFKNAILTKHEASYDLDGGERALMDGEFKMTFEGILLPMTINVIPRG